LEVPGFELGALHQCRSQPDFRENRREADHDQGRAHDSEIRRAQQAGKDDHHRHL